MYVYNQLAGVCVCDCLQSMYWYIHTIDIQDLSYGDLLTSVRYYSKPMGTLGNWFVVSGKLSQGVSTLPKLSKV